MLNGEVALVTGASRGIGKAVAIKLAAEGAYVIVNYSGNKEAAEETVAIIQNAGGQASTYQCNVSEFNSVKEMINSIYKTHKKIDIIVNNAGITKDNLLLAMKESEYDDVMNINMKGVFNICKHAVRYMLKNKKGSIINISSISGITGNAGQVNYSASKAAIIGFSKSLAKEIGSKGIRVNVVAPGFIHSDMTDKLSEEIRDNMVKSIPLGRAGEPEDIADTVCFLASEQARYITGQVLEVNGGMNM